MSDAQLLPETADDDGHGKTSKNSQSTTPAEYEGSMRLSMHDGIAVWCDCCSCEAEPYWLAVAEEPRIDLSDHEDAHRDSAQKE